MSQTLWYRNRMFNISEIEDAANLVHGELQPTPQIAWPLLAKATGAAVWVKHENHLPTGAFKIRGGISFIDWLVKTRPDCKGVTTATRGNHGQSIARAAAAAGLEARIYVPKGNAVEKNAAMRGYGANLIEFGEDFDEARAESERVSLAEGLVQIPPFHRELVRGVSTYAYELFRKVDDLYAVYVPIGCGSGICGTIAVRDALGLKTKIVGVVSDAAPTIRLSVEARKLVETNSARTFADGIAVRVPFREPLERISSGAERIVEVSDAEVAEAIRLFYRTTHNIAEGAGAAALAALIKERDAMAGRNVAVVLSGCNIDADWLVRILQGGIPNI